MHANAETPTLPAARDLKPSVAPQALCSAFARERAEGTIVDQPRGTASASALGRGYSARSGRSPVVRWEQRR
jgi:hypothetical protein